MAGIYKRNNLYVVFEDFYYENHLLLLEEADTRPRSYSASANVNKLDQGFQESPSSAAYTTTNTLIQGMINPIIFMVGGEGGIGCPKCNFGLNQTCFPCILIPQERAS